MNIELNDVNKLLNIVHDYLEGLELRRQEDYTIELSEWIDEEVESWRMSQIIIKLYESGLKKISDKRLDEFKLLENILKNISDHVSQEVLRDILISIE
jgi:hypothetical protein